MKIRTCLGCAILVVACSSSSANAPSDAMAPTGSTTSTSTTGGGGAGGGGPTSQASVSLYLTTFANSMAGMACPASPHWVNVPDAANGGQQTSATNKGPLAIDGVDQMAVTCTVKQVSGVFEVSAFLRSPATDLNNNPVNPTLVTLSVSIAEGQTAKGTLNVQDNRTASVYGSVNETGLPDATCDFSVKPLGTTDQRGVAPGRIWASVACPRFRDAQSSNQNEICSIGTGYLVLENCAQ